MIKNRCVYRQYKKSKNSEINKRSKRSKKSKKSKRYKRSKRSKSKRSSHKRYIGGGFRDNFFKHIRKARAIANADEQNAAFDITDGPYAHIISTYLDPITDDDINYLRTITNETTRTIAHNKLLKAIINNSDYAVQVFNDLNTSLNEYTHPSINKLLTYSLDEKGLDLDNQEREYDIISKTYLPTMYKFTQSKNVYHKVLYKIIDESNMDIEIQKNNIKKLFCYILNYYKNESKAILYKSMIDLENVKNSLAFYSLELMHFILDKHRNLFDVSELPTLFLDIVYDALHDYIKKYRSYNMDRRTHKLLRRVNRLTKFMINTLNMDLNARFKYGEDEEDDRDHSLLYHVVSLTESTMSYYNSVLAILVNNMYKKNIVIDDEVNTFIHTVNIDDYQKRRIKKLHRARRRTGGADFNSKQKYVNDNVVENDEDNVGENDEDNDDSSSAYDYFVKQL